MKNEKYILDTRKNYKNFTILIINNLWFVKDKILDLNTRFYSQHFSKNYNYKVAVSNIKI